MPNPAKVPKQGGSRGDRFSTSQDDWAKVACGLRKR